MKKVLVQRYEDRTDKESAKAMRIILAALEDAKQRRKQEKGR